MFQPIFLDNTAMVALSRHFEGISSAESSQKQEYSSQKYCNNDPLQNANFNVMMLVDGTSGGGDTTERYEYTPYGQRMSYYSPGTNDPLATAPTIAEKRIKDSRPNPVRHNDCCAVGGVGEGSTGWVLRPGNGDRMGRGEICGLVCE